MNKPKSVRGKNSLSIAEVRRLLYDIGFVLQLTRAMKVEVLADAVTRRREVAPPTVDPIYAAVVA